MYQIIWDKDNPLKATILNGIDPNCFALRDKMTKEELAVRRKQREGRTPQQNLHELMRETFQAMWRATELYPWFEKSCPGYQVSKFPGRSDVNIVFRDTKQAMLFKLTWG